MESLVVAPAAEIERTLDRVIDGLVNMDAEILVQLACLCREWEAKGRRLSVSNATHARLSWKLLLLDRLLRQTRINLNVLGLEPGTYSPADGYPSPCQALNTMASLNQAWNIATGALAADQAAISVVAGNIANANTPGYTTETVQWGSAIR